jgi:hypothetical protein
MIAAEKQVITAIRQSISGERLEKRALERPQPTVDEVVGKPLEVMSPTPTITPPAVPTVTPTMEFVTEESMGSALSDGLAGL